MKAWLRYFFGPRVLPFRVDDQVTTERIEHKYGPHLARLFFLGGTLR